MVSGSTALPVRSPFLIHADFTHRWTSLGHHIPLHPNILHFDHQHLLQEGEWLPAFVLFGDLRCLLLLVSYIEISNTSGRVYSHKRLLDEAKHIGTSNITST